MNYLCCQGVVSFQGGVTARFNDACCCASHKWYELGFMPVPADFDKFVNGCNCDASIIASDGEIRFHIEKISVCDTKRNYISYYVSNVRAERKE